VATYARSLGFAEILVPRALVEEHVTHPLDDLVFVKEDAGADEGALVAGLRKLQRADPALEIDTRSTYESRLEDAAQRRSFEVYILLGLILVFCGLAVVNAVTMSTAERAGEFALLRLVGADRRLVRTMIRAETMITLVFGLTIGTIIAIPGLAARIRGHRRPDAARTSIEPGQGDGSTQVSRRQGPANLRGSVPANPRGSVAASARE
jgi:putative ABC transport system permease protein